MKILLCGYAEPGIRAAKALIRSGFCPHYILTHPSRCEINTNNKILSLVDVARDSLIDYSVIDYQNKHTVPLIVEELQPDVLVSVNWRFIFDRRTLSTASIGCINLHGSYLPRWRGFCPVTWTILSGDTYAGVTVHKIDEGCDTGDILFQQRIPILMSDDVQTLKRRMAPIETDLLLDALRSVKCWDSLAKPQNHQLATYGLQRKPEDGLIDWTLSALEIFNWVRSMTRPLPGAFTISSIGKLFIWRTQILPSHLQSELKHSRPGVVVGIIDQENSNKPCPVIQTGSGLLVLLDVTISSHASCQLRSLLSSEVIRPGVSIAD